MLRGLLLLCVLAVAYTKPSGMEPQEIKKDTFRLTYKPYDLTWKQFKKDFGKVYKNEYEEKERYTIFMKNIRDIEEHNKLYSNNEKSFFMAINQFTDMTLDEYKDYNKLQIQEIRHSNFCSEFKPDFSQKLPTSLDWRQKGYVTPVKKQGVCASSWAFSTTGSLEGQHFNRTGKLVSLSVQQLIDCSYKFGNPGCRGGWTDNAFAYIHHVGGLESEQDYHYTADLGYCKFNKSEEVAHVQACEDVPSGSEEALQHAVATVGPISVAVDAYGILFYGGGVFYEPDCSSVNVNHGMLVVGYGSYRGEKYWVVKNSWGLKWGVNGYIMMARDRGNNCAIATYASFPIASSQK